MPSRVGQGPVVKPLDLRIHEKHPALDAYRFGPSYTPYAIVAVDKRFTDAELAAEFWAAHGDANAAMTGNRRLLFSRRAMLARFAALPHYDEADQ